MVSLISENIGAILTGFFSLSSSALTLYITNHFSNKKDKKELYREKLEKSFSLLGLIFLYIVDLPIKLVSSQIEKSDDKINSKGGVITGELYMIIACYSPCLIPIHQKFMNSLLTTSNLIIEKESTDKLAEQMVIFGSIFHEYQSALQREIKKYN